MLQNVSKQKQVENGSGMILFFCLHRQFPRNEELLSQMFSIIWSCIFAHGANTNTREHKIPQIKWKICSLKKHRENSEIVLLKRC